MNKCLVFIFFLALSFSQNPSFDFSYELKYGDGLRADSQGKLMLDSNGDPIPFRFNENFLKINSGYKKYHLYLELEYSDPVIMGYPKTDIEDVFSKIYFDAQFDRFYGKIGDIYALYGSGLGLYTFFDQNIDFDNSLIGTELRYNINPDLELFLVSGTSELQQRVNPVDSIPKRFSDNELFVAGINYDLSFGYGHLLYKKQKNIMDVETVQSFWFDENLRSTLLDEYVGEQYEDNLLILNGDTLNTVSINLGYGMSTDFGDFYFEGDWADYTQLLGESVNGHRHYLSYGNNFGDLGFSYEFKDYDMPYDILTFTAPPTVAIESTSILAARNSHSINYGDEVGHQFEIVSPISSEINFLANLSVSGRHKAENKVYLRTAPGLYESIQNSEFSGTQGSEEDDYLNNLFNESSNYIQNEVSTENSIGKPNLLDYLLFDDKSDNFRAFYPYRQIYGEISGYIADDLYIKVGYDLYNEIIKHKDQISYQNDLEAINIGTDEFYNHANMIVEAALQYHSDNPIQFCEVFPECAENPGEYGFQQQFGMSSDDYLLALSFDLPEEYVLTTYDYTKAWTIPTQLTYDLSRGESLNFYLEYQSKIKTREYYDADNTMLSSNADHKNIYFSGSYTFSNNFTITLFHEKENIEEVVAGNLQSKRGDEWSGIDFSFDLEQNGQLSLFYGSQKGGRVCANGICADQPGFEEGVKVTYRTFF